ncbi:cupin domain-containing protein [Limnohabitans sp.]|jgi:mannose-6-phosphate isomerase-like protein (cupin superfamily)
MSTSLPVIQRIVTGHDARGKAVVTTHGPLPTVVELLSVPGTVFHEIWSTSGAPCLVSNGEDPTRGPLTLPPPHAGTRIRFVDIPPETSNHLAPGTEKLRQAFAEIGDAAASTAKTDSPHPLMHRTETLDYGVVIDGEVVLVLDDSEVLLQAGSVVIQRGTNHAWANRSNRTCRMLFVLVDGVYDSAINPC